MQDLSTTTTWRDEIVALFPGQGSIGAGAGGPWRSSRHWDVVTRVSEVTGVDVAHLLLDAEDADVIRTDHAQLATFALSMIGYRELLGTGVRPRYLMGHSLGEFSALCASGLLDLDGAATLIDARGRAMQRAAQERDGSMVAVMGGDEDARAALEGLEDVWVANVNGTGQIVVSGTREGLARVLEGHRELGWRRATALPVGGAFHSPLMASAQTELVRALAETTWGTTEPVLIANVDGAAHVSAEEWRDLLARQLTSPVEFLAATQSLPDTVTTTIEMPPGAVLTGLVKRIRDFDTTLTPADPAQFKELGL